MTDQTTAGTLNTGNSIADRLAPYPRDEDNARDRLGRHYTVDAYVAYIQAMDVAGDLAALIPASKTYFDAFSLACAFRTAASQDETAEYLVWARDEDDQLVNDILVRWLKADGIDPETVIQAVRAESGNPTGDDR